MRDIKSIGCLNAGALPKEQFNQSDYVPKRLLEEYTKGREDMREEIAKLFHGLGASNEMLDKIRNLGKG